jgi:hypothetical protein
MNSSGKNSVKNSGNSTSFVSKSIFFILLILFILVIVYIIYFAYQRSQYVNDNEPIIVSDITDANVAYQTTLNVTPKDGMAQSMSTWIYVKSWDYNNGKYKNILWKTDTSTPNNGIPLHTPSLWLYPLTNNLKVITSVETAEGVESCDINNIPLMKWVHITYVLNNRTVDVYINGKLERSCALKGIPKGLDTSTNLFVTYGKPAGFMGKIGKTQYFTRALQPNEVTNLYTQGPIGSSQYNVQFFQDGKFIQISDQTSITEMS